MSKSKQSSYYLYGAAVLVVVGLVVFAANNSVGQSAPSPYDAFENVNYIECSTASRTMNQTCRDAGIEGYPAWEFGDGSRASGEQSLTSLSDASGCALPLKE